jgi:osmoprotectant transport system ATP-binding protein
VISFESVTKQFADGTVAVRALDLEVAEGELVVLVGPSGCGKTTTMRMVNRMIEPTSGRVLLGGRDVADVPAPDLRRGIGYVIQQVGLFPHRTTVENIATVPELLGWDRARTAQRVEELMALVGLPPDLADRYPHQLSGGQRQRVGVARALAVDPPVMLMDEPFGAVDPLVRGRLQEEFLSLQQAMRKTVLFVTHDIDEAITLGDRVAVMSDGEVAQFDAPEAILAEPANDFVREFLGAERGLKRLALIPVSEVKAEAGPVTRPDDTRQAAAEAAGAAGTNWVVVVDEAGVLRGWAWLDDVTGRAPDAELHPILVRLQASDSLRTALDAMVTSHTGVAVRVRPGSAGDRYEGILTQELLTQELV